VLYRLFLKNSEAVKPRFAGFERLEVHAGRCFDPGRCLPPCPGLLWREKGALRHSRDLYSTLERLPSRMQETATHETVIIWVSSCQVESCLNPLASKFHLGRALSLI
jgi:hypothetical protein